MENSTYVRKNLERLNTPFIMQYFGKYVPDSFGIAIDRERLIDAVVDSMTLELNQKYPNNE